MLTSQTFPTSRWLPGSVSSWFWAAAGLGMSLVLVLVYLSLRVPIYQSTAVLLIGPKTSLKTGAVEPSPQYIRSQLDFLRSQSVLDPVVASLGLANKAAFTNGVARNANNAMRVQRARDELRRRLAFENDGQSYVIHVSARASDPALAASLANSVANSYASLHQAATLAQIGQHAHMLGKLLPKLHQQALSADAEVERYRRTANIVMVSSVPEDGKNGSNFAPATAASMEIIHMAEERAMLARDAIDTHQRLNAQQRAIAHGRGQTTAEVLRSPLVSQLRQMEAEASENVANLRKRYQPDNPKLTAAEAQLASIRSDLRAEIGRIHASVQIKAWAAGAALQAGDRFNRILELQRNRDLAVATQMKQLQREATLKRTAYEQAALGPGRASKISDAQVPEVLVVSPASPSLRPLGFPRTAVLPIAAAGGLVVGLILAFAAKLRRRSKLAI